MPCKDTTSALTATVDYEDRLTDFSYNKITCGKTVGTGKGFLNFLQGMSIEDICAMQFEQIISNQQIRRHIDEFMTYLEWSALKDLLLEYSGKIEISNDQRVQISSIEYEERGAVINAVVHPLKEMPEVEGCGTRDLGTSDSAGGAPTFFLKVSGIEHYNDQLFRISLDRSDLEFEAGECVNIFNEDRSAKKPYSMASGVNESEISFVIRKMDKGVISSYLATRKPGDLVEVSEAFGNFRLGVYKDARKVFIASGTGIAPFWSYFRSFPEAPPQALFYGARHTNDLMEIPAFEQWCPTEYAISRQDNSSHFKGRLTHLLHGRTFEDGTHFFLCGNGEMIQSVSVLLLSSGVPEGCIHKETFLKSAVSIVGLGNLTRPAGLPSDL